jgi:cysteine desulfurase/selenocysteine lyase
MEHHSNIVPWQMICEERGARLRVIPMNDRGELLIDEFQSMLSPKTKLVSVVYISNSLGTVNPVRSIIESAHANGTPVLIDGAQVVAHRSVDVRELDCDFFVFSGHKLFAPTGVGVLYGKTEWLEKMNPYQGGGDMIRSVTFEKTTYNDLPYKFEAGTPNISGAIGLGAAIDFVQIVGLDAIADYEDELLRYGTERLSSIDGVRLIGTAEHKSGAISFLLDQAHPHDIGTILDREGIAIRTGHHCTQPVMQRFGIPATARASISCYNTKEEFDLLAQGIMKVKEIFG